MEAKKIKIKTLIICLGAICFVEVARWLVTSKNLWDPMIGLGTARLFETILILLIVLLWGKGLTSVGLAPSKIFQGVIKGLTWSVGFGVLALLGFFILSIYGHNPLQLIKTRLPRWPGDILLFYLVGGIVAPIAEEVFFRGVLYGFFRRWGVVVALVLSTVLFVLPHLGGHGPPVTQIIGGLLFAVAYEIEGNLMTPITIHSLGNLTIFTISLLT